MNSVPLADVLPWGDSIPTGGRTILICDSTETDGRFLLHTLASQCLNSPSMSSSSSPSISTGSSIGSSSFRRNNNKNVNINVNVNNNIRGTKKNTNKNNGQVLWIHCGCFTNDQLRSALKKAGCDSASVSSSSSLSSKIGRAPGSSVVSGSLGSSGSSSQVEIINIMNDLSEYYLKMNTNKNTNYTAAAKNANLSKQENDSVKDDHHDEEVNYQQSYLKSIYQKVKKWLKEITDENDNDDNDDDDNDSHINSQSSSSNNKNPLIILDNASLLSTQFGPQLTHAFIQTIQNMISSVTTSCTSDNSSTVRTTKNRNKKGKGCFAILCSHDLDQEYYLNSTQQSNRNTNVTGAKIMQYIGGGGRGILCNAEEMAMLNQQALFELENSSFVWERSLIELSDGIIDVIPLSSGFARDVHGRLIFTERMGSMGWKDVGMGVGIMAVSGEGSRSQARKITTSQSSFSTTTVNFCCHDSGVRAIRLRV